MKGLGSAKYANAVILEEGMYRLHIAPLLEMICEALTKVYLRPRLIKDGVPAEIVEHIVVTFDPSAIVTRPDKAQAANDGYDRKVLSSAGWRAARGFPESDAPTQEERFSRLMAEKAVVPPDTAAAVLEYMGGNALSKARHYVESINASDSLPSATPSADPRAEPGVIGVAPGEGPGTGANQTTGPGVQTPTAPGQPIALPPELTEILPPEPEQQEPTRPRNVVPGSNAQAGRDAAAQALKISGEELLRDTPVRFTERSRFACSDPPLGRIARLQCRTRFPSNLLRPCTGVTPLHKGGLSPYEYDDTREEEPMLPGLADPDFSQRIAELTLNLKDADVNLEELTNEIEGLFDEADGEGNLEAMRLLWSLMEAVRTEQEAEPEAPAEPVG